jgi:hypothetical protein
MSAHAITMSNRVRVTLSDAGDPVVAVIALPSPA